MELPWYWKEYNWLTYSLRCDTEFFGFELLDFLLCLGILRLKYQSTEKKAKVRNIGEQKASSGDITFDLSKAWLHH